jgi:hypothetical protein
MTRTYTEKCVKLAKSSRPWYPQVTHTTHRKPRNIQHTPDITHRWIKPHQQQLAAGGPAPIDAAPTTAHAGTSRSAKTAKTSAFAAPKLASVPSPQPNEETAPHGTLHPPSELTPTAV